MTNKYGISYMGGAGGSLFLLCFIREKLKFKAG